MLYVLGWIADSLQQQLSSSAEEDAADRQRDEPRPSEGGGQRIHSRLAAQDHQHERYDLTAALVAPARHSIESPHTADALCPLHIGVDKKTSVLDYLVRSLYDKQEVDMLQVVDELSLVDENSKLSGSEVLNEYSGLEQALLQLEQDYSMNSSRCNALHMQSPTAKTIIDEFNSRLLDHLTAFRHRMSECEKVQTLLRKKLDEIASYFGEDTNTSCCCDTRKLFGVLSEFKRALLLSKASTEWRISRSSLS